MKLLITISILLTAAVCHSQPGIDQVKNPDLIKVKIISIKKADSITTVKMKTLASPRVKLTTECCNCVVPYKKKDIVWIRKPDNF